MAEIKIISIAPGSKEENGKVHLAFTLSAQPGSAWISSLKNFEIHAQSNGIDRLEVQGNVLSFEAKSAENEQALLDQVKTYVADANKEQGDFRERLSNLKFE